MIPPAIVSFDRSSAEYRQGARAMLISVWPTCGCSPRDGWPISGRAAPRLETQRACGRANMQRARPSPMPAVRDDVRRRGLSP